MSYIRPTVPASPGVRTQQMRFVEALLLTLMASPGQETVLQRLTPARPLHRAETDLQTHMLEQEVGLPKLC